jgi:ribonuclease HII
VVHEPGARIAGVDDSKRLVAGERQRLFEIIRVRALGVGIAVVDHVTIDRINILQATRLAMAQALAALDVPPELVLTDFVEVPGLRCPQRNLVDGDRRSASVAAASIIAKVTRDRIMEAADRDFPAYGFGRHKGYATPEHREALERHGPCPLHRRTFAGIWSQLTLFSRGELQWIDADSVMSDLVPVKE